MTAPGERVEIQAPMVTGFRKILKNSATLISARIISKFAMTVFMVVLARSLGTEDFGVYSSIIAFIAFFSLVEEFGMTPPMIRKISKDRARGGEILGAIVGLKTVLGVVGYVMLIVTSYWVGMPLRITAVLGLSMIFEVLALTVTRAFEAFEMMKTIAVITIVERFLLCAAGLGAIFMGWSLPGLSYAYLFTFICSFSLASYMFRKHVTGFRPHFPAREWRPVLREALPFLTASVLSIVWTRVDIYYLTSFRSSADVGLYNAALRVVEAQIFIPVAILSSVFPVLSRLHGVSHREFTRILWKNFFFLLVIGAAVAALTWILSTEIVDILFGRKYEDSAVVLRIFSPMILFSFLNYLLGGALIAMGRELTATMTLGLGAVLCVVCGFFFIPSGGPPAAGYIKAAAEALSFIFQGAALMIALRREGRAVEAEGWTPEGPRDEGDYQAVTSRVPDG